MICTRAGGYQFTTDPDSGTGGLPRTLRPGAARDQGESVGEGAGGGGDPLPRRADGTGVRLHRGRGGSRHVKKGRYWMSSRWGWSGDTGQTWSWRS